MLAEDQLTFPVAGAANVDIKNPAREIPEWQRWNDYGIGMLLKGKAELRQAAEAFRKVEDLGRFDGPLDLARTLVEEAGPGQLDEAAAALQRAAAHTDPPGMAVDGSLAQRCDQPPAGTSCRSRGKLPTGP
ncbi:MAG UNVERIFIED_CONTAM: hypothetical protein LVR18_14045 [Planctomycetaceae bacterium]